MASLQVLLPNLGKDPPPQISPRFIHFAFSVRMPFSSAPLLFPFLPAGQATQSTILAPSPSPPPSSNPPTTPKSHPKPRIFPGTAHRHSYLKGKCGNHKSGCSGSLVGPIWSPKSAKFFVRCSYQPISCNFFRYTDYDTSTSPTPTAPNVTFATAPVTSQAISRVASSPEPCAHQPCVGNNRRPVNALCVNKMCLKDCVANGPLRCRVPGHKKARLAIHGGYQLPMPTYPVPPPPPSASQHPTPILSQITTSSVLPTAREPFPRPIASPEEEGTDFAEIRTRTYAREFPSQEWVDAVVKQQEEYARRMQYAARFRKDTMEGTTVHVAIWVKDGERPQLFERVLHLGTEYCLSDDVDLCGEIGFPPESTFIGLLVNGQWFLRSPRERIRIVPGQWLLFRLRSIEDTPGSEELAALADHPYISPPRITSSSAAPRPCPKPTPRHKDIIQVPDTRYPWISVAASPSSIDPSPSFGSSTLDLPLSPSPVDPSPSFGSSTLDSSTLDLPLAPVTSSSSTSTTLTTLTTLTTTTTTSSSSTNESRVWPLEYTVKEIHEGFKKLFCLPVLPKGQRTLAKRFALVWPEVRHQVSAYYKTYNVWKVFLDMVRI